ncbi:MAG: L,D-transpeptidase family protein [Alicyclobacillus sp.]|nr:L,D-transpeptidase family protein [Alicyclobacillus sp.]
MEQLQIELAETGYLPLTYTPPTGGEPTQLGGRWTWTYPAIPRGLAQLWNPTTFTVLTESAVMTFEQVHGLAVDGIAGPKVLGALMHDLSAHRKSPYGFTFVMVSTHLPEQLELWHNGAVVVKTPVNTGIPASPTVTGTYPVYLQYRSQTMSGVDPSGHPYRDPGVPYVSYFYGGEAVHGFVRSAYGYPQSLGCVELPISAAQQVWPYMHLGTLVQISSASDA